MTKNTVFGVISMYFGSVKFFKRLILTVFWSLVAAAVVLAVVFGILYGRAKSRIGTVSAEVSDGEKLNISKDASIDEIYSALRANGYSAEEILDCVNSYDESAFASYISAKKDVTPVSETTVASETEQTRTSDVASAETVQTVETEPEYMALFPDLYATAPTEEIESDNTVYLTFDDGPSKNTPDILRILDKYDIKATFFMCGGDDEYTKMLMKQVADRGHTIGVHSITHDYEKIYSSVDSYLEDMNNTYMSIYNATGVKPQLIRFPGGSVNDYNKGLYRDLITEVTRRGFTYFDWNVSGEDAVEGATWTTIYNNVTEGVQGISNGRAVVLLHDSADKYTTVTTVEDIIINLQAKGYTFAPLDNTVKPVTFRID